MSKIMTSLNILKSHLYQSVVSRPILKSILIDSVRIKFFGKNPFMIYALGIFLSFLTYFISDNPTYMEFIVVFLLFLAVDYGLYEKLKPKCARIDLLIGIFLIVLSFFASGLKRMLTGEIVYAVRFVFGSWFMLTLGLTLLIYGYRNITKFAIPFAVVIALFIVETTRTSYIDSPPVFAYLIPFTASAAVGLVKLFGYDVSFHPNDIIIHGNHGVLTASMGGGCSGIDGIIFYSLLAAFLLIRVPASRKRKVICILLGSIGTLFVNILRVVVLILVGVYYGHEAMMYAHSNLGDILFVIYVGIYWYVSFKWILKEDKPKKPNRKVTLKAKPSEKEASDNDEDKSGQEGTYGD